jgi:hypothetical protein
MSTPVTTRSATRAEGKEMTVRIVYYGWDFDE